MARYVFVADRRPDWQLAEQLVSELDHDALLVAGDAYESSDTAFVRIAMLEGLSTLESVWHGHFFIDGGVVVADTMELERLATAFVDVGIGEVAGLIINATVRWRRAVSGPRTPADASPRTP
jgi:hypothetical protein